MKIIREKYKFIIFSLGILSFLFYFYTVSYTTAGSTKNKIVNPIKMTKESIETGRLIFLDYCAGCHGARADGRGRQALNLEPKPQNLRNTQFVRYLTDERILSSISGGVLGTAMPANEMNLSKDQRWHVINYVRSLSAMDKINLPNSIAFEEVSDKLLNPVASSKESIANGDKLFAKYCSYCHGKDGDGNGEISVNLVPGPRNLLIITSWGTDPFIDHVNDARIYDSVVNGVPGTSMQPWIKVLSKNERWDIVNFFRVQAKKRIEKINIKY